MKQVSTPETIMIDSVKYVRADAVTPPAGDVKIAVLDRGFVYIGRVKIDGDFLTISNAQNIRVWGTTKGLGELVNGPTSSTKTDKVGTVRVPMRALISLIDVDGGKWSGI
jgi:hypothetical protein